MELVREDTDADTEEVDAETTSLISPTREELYQNISFPNAVRRTAYHFDGMGNYFTKEWNLTEGRGKEFCWYHVELPKENQKLSLSAQHLIDVLCPPLKLQDILALVSNGPFCGYVDGALVFRVNSAGPPTSKFTHRLAARVTEKSVITVSLGRVPRLGFKRMEKSLLYEIPRVEKSNLMYGEGRAESSVDVVSENEFESVTVIKEHVLEFLLTMNHSEEADNPVPKTVSNLIVHIVDTHMDQLQDIVTTLGLELDTVELELDKGGFVLKKQMLDERRFPKMHLNLQRLLQVIAHGEQVFPRVRERCASRSWFASEDIVALEELISRLRRLKENVGFITNRVTAIQAGLDSWQAEQINRKLYYLSFLSLVFLPLSVVTGVFGMNVGGVPWTTQGDSNTRGGFRNVLVLCFALILLLLLCFSAPYLYTRLSTWRRPGRLRRSLSMNWKSFSMRSIRGGSFHGGGSSIHEPRQQSLLVTVALSDDPETFEKDMALFMVCGAFVEKQLSGTIIQEENEFYFVENETPATAMFGAVKEAAGLVQYLFDS